MSSITVPTLRTAPRPVSTTPRRTAGSGSAPVMAAPVMAAPVSPATFRRRRVVVIAALVVFAFLVTVVIGRVGAEAGLQDRVAGHVVVEPGQTLWDVAVATAPEGVDTRQQLSDLRELNGLDAAHLDPWTVVLIPAR